jgi:streptomycin 6-kinase
MCYYFSKTESKKIIEHFGQPFFEKVLRNIEVYSDRWKLNILNLVDYYSINCIFICYSELYGDAVLKICNNSGGEVLSEYNSLREYNGRRFCKVFACDIENSVILIERVIPGIQLKDEKSLEKRLSVFSSLYNGLHIEPANAGLYPTYVEWVCSITEYMSRRGDHKELYLHMQKAKDICLSASALYSKKMLLHGDFHYDNILLNSNDEYTIIDPKGVIGDPVFDVPRYILNEYCDEDIEISFKQRFNKINKVIDYFEKSLNIPSKILKQCLYIEMAMSACWEVESDNAPDLDSVVFAEAVMNS